MSDIYLNNMDKNLFSNFDNATILKAASDNKSEEFLTILKVFKDNEVSQSSSRHNFANTLIEELSDRLDNNKFDVNNIIKNLNSTNLYLTSSFLEKKLSEDTSLFVPILKKIAHLKSDYHVRVFINIVLSHPEFALSKDKPHNLSPENMKILKDAFHVVNTNGNHYAIKEFFPYLYKIDSRNILAITTRNDLNYKQKALVEKNNLKEYFIYNQFNQVARNFILNDNNVISNDLLSITNLIELYDGLLKHNCIKNSAFQYYEAKDILIQGYESSSLTQQDKELFDNYLLSIINNSKRPFIETSLIGVAMEQSPHLREVLLDYFITHKLLPDEQKSNKISHLITIMRKHPQIINVLPEEYWKDSIFNLIEHTSIIFKFWKMDNTANALNNLMEINKEFLFINKNNKFQQGKENIFSDNIKNFPFENLVVSDEDINAFIIFYQNTIDLNKELKSNLIERTLLKATNSLSIEFKEALIAKKILNYQDILFAEKYINEDLAFNSPTRNLNKSISKFDFNITDLNQPAVKSFLKYMSTHNVEDCILQLIPKQDFVKGRLDMSMELLLNFSKEELLQGFISINKNIISSYSSSYSVRKDCLENFIEDIYTYQNRSLVHSFIKNNFLDFNKDEKGKNISSNSAVLNYCYILVEQEKMLAETEDLIKERKDSPHKRLKF